MKNWQKFLRQYWQMILTAVAIIVLVTVVSALGGGDRLKGSSYSLEPQGYGAWYQKMVDQGIAIERWRKPVARVFDKYPNGTILLQINSELDEFFLDPPDKKWIENGNTLVVLGVDALSNDIEFSKNLASPQGQVKIETTRRFQVTDSSSSYFKLPTIPTSIVSDDHGAVVWQSSIGKGKLILATTPYLAANAYQDSTANYDLLTALTTTDQQRIVVDEYLHGYREPSKPRKPGDPILPDDSQQSEGENLMSYFTKTPFLVAFVRPPTTPRTGCIVMPVATRPLGLKRVITLAPVAGRRTRLLLVPLRRLRVYFAPAGDGADFPAVVALGPPRPALSPATVPSNTKAHRAPPLVVHC